MGIVLHFSIFIAVGLLAFTDAEVIDAELEEKIHELYIDEKNEADGKTIDQVIWAAAIKAGPRAIDGEIQNGTVVMMELDMAYTKEDYDEMMRERTDITKRASPISERLRWTGKTIPYKIDGTFSTEDKEMLQGVFADYHRLTCLKFKPRSSESNYINFMRGGGCWSYVGMLGRGKQDVSLDNGCRSHGTASHELGHAAGLNHEQCRPDRDNYVTIHYENVEPANAYNFDKSRTSGSRANSAYGIAYDYGAVMQYGPTSFSMNGKVTIDAKDPNWKKLIGKRGSGLSFGDLKLLNTIYKCGDHCGGKTCRNGGYLDKNCKCQCKGCPLQSCDGSGPFENLSCVCKDIDSERKCRGYKSSGYCADGQRYANYAQGNCPVTCGVCRISDGGNGGGSGGGSGGGGGGSCSGVKDSQHSATCQIWKEAGYCKTVQSVKTACKKTCGIC